MNVNWKIYTQLIRGRFDAPELLPDRVRVQWWNRWTPSTLIDIPIRDVIHAGQENQEFGDFDGEVIDRVWQDDQGEWHSKPMPLANAMRELFADYGHWQIVLRDAYQFFGDRKLREVQSALRGTPRGTINYSEGYLDSVEEMRQYLLAMRDVPTELRLLQRQKQTA
jgi:hypothetical protein